MLYVAQLTLGGLEVSRSSVVCEPAVLLPLLIDIRVLGRNIYKITRGKLRDRSHPSH